MHGIANSHKDINMCDFISTEFLQEQVDSAKEIGDHITNLKRVGEGLGTYRYDQQLTEIKD